MRRIFTVLINKKEYDVYNIEGKEHAGHNDTPKEWWLYFSDRLPSGVLPPFDSEKFVPYSYFINRRLWDISFKQTNTSKYKWDDYSFSSHTQVEMHCNGRLIYSFGTTGNDYGLSFAMDKVGYLKVVLSEHPYNFFEPEENDGRKIYWYGLPATVSVKKHSPWEISINPDYTAGLDENEWWKEYFNRKKRINNKKLSEELDFYDEEESRYRGSINWGDALSDDHIGWFRD